MLSASCFYSSVFLDSIVLSIDCFERMSVISVLIFFKFSLN